MSLWRTATVFLVAATRLLLASAQYDEYGSSSGGTSTTTTTTTTHITHFAYEQVVCDNNAISFVPDDSFGCNGENYCHPGDSITVSGTVTFADTGYEIPSYTYAKAAVCPLNFTEPCIKLGKTHVDLCYLLGDNEGCEIYPDQAYTVSQTFQIPGQAGNYYHGYHIGLKADLEGIGNCRVVFLAMQEGSGGSMNSSSDGTSGAWFTGAICLVAVAAIYAAQRERRVVTSEEMQNMRDERLVSDDEDRPPMDYVEMMRAPSLRGARAV